MRLATCHSVVQVHSPEKIELRGIQRTTAFGEWGPGTIPALSFGCFDVGLPFPVVVNAARPPYSTVTLFARLRGLSTSVPRAQAV
jgi:hypothetical protein